MKNSSRAYLNLVYNLAVFVIMSCLLDKTESMSVRFILSAVLVVSATFCAGELKNIIKNHKK